MVAAHLVANDHVKWGCGGALLDIPPHMEASGVGAVMDQLVDHSRVAMEAEDDWSGLGKQLHKHLILQAVRMVPVRFQAEQVHYAHHSHPQLRDLLPQ